MWVPTWAYDRVGPGVSPLRQGQGRAWLAKRSSSVRITCSTRLSGVDAPEVTPMRERPRGRHPAGTGHLRLRGHVPMPNRVGRHQPVRRGDVEGPHPGAAEAGEVAGVAAVVAAHHHHQVQRLLAEQAGSRRPADPGSRCRSCRTPGSAAPTRPRQTAASIASRNISPICQRLRAEHGRLVGASDAGQVEIGIEAGGDRLAEPRPELLGDPAAGDVAAHVLGLDRGRARPGSGRRSWPRPGRRWPASPRARTCRG